MRTTKLNTKRATPKKVQHQKHHSDPPSITLSQRDLQGNNQELSDAEEYGDIMAAKRDNVLRIMLHNINRLPISAKSDKSRQLISTIANKQIDVALLTEIGLCWKLLDNKDQWFERVRMSFQSSRSEFAYNKTEMECTEVVQFGGVGAMAMDDVSHRVVSQGSDPTKLGRWSWIRMEGKQGHHLPVVAAYRPVVSIGIGTVYSQQTLTKE